MLLLLLFGSENTPHDVIIFSHLTVLLIKYVPAT